MTLTQLQAAARKAMGPLDQWAHQCHAASIHLVESGVIKGARVARGTCGHVGGQHSWVVLGDPYDNHALIIDCTLWSYANTVRGIWVGAQEVHRHKPHGDGNIFTWGRPPEPVGPIVELVPKKPWSTEARVFLNLLGPLDRNGWRVLAHAPVRGWPASEIFTALAQSDMGGDIPMDIVGMVTELNPGKLYPRS